MPLVIIATITHNNELGSHPTKTNKYSTTVYAECSPDQLEFPYEPSLVERLNAFLVVAADASSNISQVVIGGRIINPSGSTGDWAILLYVNCLGGVTCNQTGKIIATVKECGSDGRILASETSRQGVTLTESSPLKLKIQNLPVGNFCVDAFLDVNSNGIRNTGDIVAASGEIPIKLDHRVESVTINLDTVFP